jgi:hypothetical protein
MLQFSIYWKVIALPFRSRREHWTPPLEAVLCSWHFPEGRERGPSRFNWNVNKLFSHPDISFSRYIVLRVCVSWFLNHIKRVVLVSYRKRQKAVTTSQLKLLCRWNSTLWKRLTCRSRWTMTWLVHLRPILRLYCHSLATKVWKSKCQNSGSIAFEAILWRLVYGHWPLFAGHHLHHCQIFIYVHVYFQYCSPITYTRRAIKVAS